MKWNKSMLAKCTSLGAISLFLFQPVSTYGMSDIPYEMDFMPDLRYCSRASMLEQERASAEVDYYLVVWLKDGSNMNFSFADKPTILYKDGQLLLKTVQKEVAFTKGEVLNFTLAKTGDAILGIEKSLTQGDFNQTGDGVFITGGRPGARVYVYDISGKIVYSTSIEANGECHVSLNNQRTGCYIVKLESVTCKIIKK